MMKYISYLMVKKSCTVKGRRWEGGTHMKPLASWSYADTLLCCYATQLTMDHASLNERGRGTSGGILLFLLLNPYDASAIEEEDFYWGRSTGGWEMNRTRRPVTSILERKSWGYFLHHSTPIGQQ